MVAFRLYHPKHSDSRELARRRRLARQAAEWAAAAEAIDCDDYVDIGAVLGEFDDYATAVVARCVARSKEQIACAARDADSAAAVDDSAIYRIRESRAIADLTARLHGLIHVCLLAARVSTAQATTVASR